MSTFIPTGYLTVPAAIDRVVELMQGDDLSRLLTEDERATLRNWQAYFYRITHPQPAPVTPVPKADGSNYFGPRSPGEKYPHRPVEAKPERPDITREVLRDLKEKEAFFNEQRLAAGKVLRQLLYAGRVPWEIITEDGARIAAPKHLPGGNQWYEALRSNRVTFRPGILSVTGVAVIPQDALEAAFTPDGDVKKEPEAVAPEAAVVGAPQQPRRKSAAKPTHDQQRKKVTKPRGRGGRKPGSGAYTAQDRSLWEKMKTALDSEKAKSIWDATKQFAGEASGTSVFDNKRRRLAKGYRNWIRTQ